MHIEHSPGKFKEIEIILSMFSNNNAMRLESTTRKKKTVKNHKHMEAKQYASNQPMDH